jgi:hypothetical protein
MAAVDEVDVVVVDDHVVAAARIVEVHVPHVRAVRVPGRAVRVPGRAGRVPGRGRPTAEAIVGRKGGVAAVPVVRAVVAPAGAGRDGVGHLNLRSPR